MTDAQIQSYLSDGCYATVSSNLCAASASTNNLMSHYVSNGGVGAAEAGQVSEIHTINHERQ